MSKAYYVGVDVGTGSVRAALVDGSGAVHKVHVKETKTWNPAPDHYEQSSDDIWQCICECVRVVTSDQNKKSIGGIGFDATCSLVAIDHSGHPITVSTTGEHNQNVILWMDHRADVEAKRINATNHGILKYVGGAVSIEMEIPKVMWLKSNLSQTHWNNIGKLFDLPDYLTFKCTGDDTRSLCSLVCKWNYDGVNNCWPSDFFDEIGLNDVSKNDFEMLGKEVTTPGTSIDRGLSKSAADELGLCVGTPVAASMIDAHAGALSLLGCQAEGINDDVSTKMALICGTSSCHMSIENELVWTNGVWGPYKGAVLPDYYLHEGGQSATGILLDFIVKNHPAYSDALSKAGPTHIFAYLHDHLKQMAADKNVDNVQLLTQDFHVWPDLHGNRSPLADPTIKGMICGLTLTASIDNLAITYLGFVQALAYGTRHILDQLKEGGRKPFESILISGGLRKNALFVETHADACKLPVLIPHEGEMVLVGSAMLAACAAKQFPTLRSASQQMASKCGAIEPNDNIRAYHERKYKVFRELVKDQMKYKQIMES